MAVAYNDFQTPNADPKACYYCGDEYLRYMKPIGRLRMSTAYMAGFQKYYPGRCIVTFYRHAEEWFELTPEELAGFSADIAQLAEAICKTFPCDKLNYGICGDGNRHLHMHIVPKLKNGYTWGKLFDMLPPVEDQILLPEAELDDMIARIRANMD